jgi:Mn-containing catalase
MFFHTKRLQYNVRVDRPDPVYAKQLQELIGGQYGEMTVMMQYLFQGWNLRGDEQDERLKRVKDMTLDIGTEEIAHVEMLATCVAMLLDGASPEAQEEAAKSNPVLYATLGSMNPQHMIVAGLGARPADSAGNPWSGFFTTSSGNPVADAFANVNAEVQGRLQATRLYEMSSDSGVREMLSFLIARDRMHQNQWLAMIEELGGMQQALPVPVTFPFEKEAQEFGYAFMDFSKDPDGASAEGRWASGPSIDGKGQFSYVGNPEPHGEAPHLAPAPGTIHGAIPGGPASPDKGAPLPGTSGGLIDRVTDAITGDS